MGGCLHDAEAGIERGFVMKKEKRRREPAARVCLTVIRRVLSLTLHE